MKWFAFVMMVAGCLARAEEVSPVVIGRKIFMDTSLSQPVGQGCVSCHDPKAAFADARRVSPGAVNGRKGRRNAPTLMYAALIPPIAAEDFYDEEGELIYVLEGGLFLDGRAHDQFEQVLMPFFNKDEMNLSGPADLAARIRKSEYASDFKKLVGGKVWGNDGKLVDQVYHSLVAFLREPMFRPFNARIDDFWKGDVKALNDSELRGLALFQSKAGCAQCHPLGVGTWPEPLLSDFGYDNLGAPSIGGKDPGLGGVSGRKNEMGQFRSPTLRNIALTAPYLHNGSIKTLKEVMEFYNKRDVEPKRWGKTDFPETVNHDDMGDLKLTDQEVDDLVALMHTFTDKNLLEMREGDELPKTPEGVPSTESRKAFFQNRPRLVDPKAKQRVPEEKVDE
ncbi:MAG: c-type cytochrome [Akkermansiaceae bacterium]|nr:c-type cytochrome [Akkermansiaceae bacterium]